MATTRIIPMHISKGKTIAQCLRDRIDYGKNPEKTNDGELVSSYECAPETADQEFLLARNEYIALTGRRPQGEVIAYQVRQSFKPGEVSPEEANKIGYEFAERFLKGKHAFIVATHVDRDHIHNHIYWSSVTLDCTRKFRNFYHSHKAMERLSDQICMEHRLSVITEKSNQSVSYDKWLGEKTQPRIREIICMAIDDALKKQPEGFNALIQLLEEAGFRIKRGKQISLLPPNGKRYIRMDTLGEAYSESSLKAVLSGEATHIPRKYRSLTRQKGIGLLIDIEKKLREGKGKGYEIWASRNNTSTMAKTMVYVKEHKLENYAAMDDMISRMSAQRDKLKQKIVKVDIRMNELARQRKTITTYRRTRDVYVQYHESGWSKQFYKEHMQEIDSHLEAKKAYDAVQGKMPTLKDISAEFDLLRLQKQVDREAYHVLQAELREALNVKSNIDQITRDEQEDKEQQKRNHRSRT